MQGFKKLMSIKMGFLSMANKHTVNRQSTVTHKDNTPSG